MKRTVIHKQVYRRGPFGASCRVNATLCGRMQNDLPDGMNVSGSVTCKFCLRIMKLRHERVDAPPPEEANK
jgi:hypothetical protein